jgi:thiosulfate reductase cytochrome b subunit
MTHGKAAPERDPDVVFRHRLSTRLWHWTNVVAFFVLLMSGLMIFNAHPRLYWGQYGANPDPAWLEIGSTGERGFVRIGDWSFATTGVLGLWEGPNGQLQRRAFPSWATIPSSYSLAGSRRWRQLGYRHAKFDMRIEAVSSLAGIGRGQGGFWEDVGNYDWYAGM